MENKTVVVVQPASTEVVYVPSYNPVVVYGPPVYPYPPVYYPPPPPPGAYVATAAVAFGVGMTVGAAYHGGYGWGCGWGHNDVDINVNNNFNRNTNINRNTNVNGNRAGGGWQHVAAQSATSGRRTVFESGDRQQIRRHGPRRLHGKPSGGRAAAIQGRRGAASQSSAERGAASQPGQRGRERSFCRGQRASSRAGSGGSDSVGSRERSEELRQQTRVPSEAVPADTAAAVRGPAARVARQQHERFPEAAADAGDSGS